MITKYLPEFKVFEVGSLTGLRAGHVVSQQPAAASIAKKAVGENNFIENGISANGLLPSSRLLLTS